MMLLSFCCRYATFSTRTSCSASLSSCMKHIPLSLHNLPITIGFCHFSTSSSHHSLQLHWEFLIRMYQRGFASRYVRVLTGCNYSLPQLISNHIEDQIIEHSNVKVYQFLLADTLDNCLAALLLVILYI